MVSVMSSALAASPRRTSAIGESRRSSQPLSVAAASPFPAFASVTVSIAPAAGSFSGNRSNPTSFQPSAVRRKYVWTGCCHAG